MPVFHSSSPPAQHEMLTVHSDSPRDSLFTFLELEQECQQEPVQPVAGQHAPQHSAPGPHHQQAVQRLSGSLGRHELVVARLKQQLALSVTSHELQLTQELQDAIKHAALTTAAGAAAGAAVAAAEHALSGASGRGSLSGGACFPSLNGSAAGARQLQLVASADAAELIQLRAAAAQANQLRQQLQASEAKLAVHRTAAGTAKDKMLQLEEFLQALELQHQQQLERLDQQERLLAQQRQVQAEAEGQLRHKDAAIQALAQQLQQQQAQAGQQQQQAEEEGCGSETEPERVVSPKHEAMDQLEQHVRHMQQQAELQLQQMQAQHLALVQQQDEAQALLQQREELARQQQALHHQQQELELREQQLSQRRAALQEEERRVAAERRELEAQQQEAWQQQQQQQHELLVVQQSLGLLEQQLSFTSSQLLGQRRLSNGDGGEPDQSSQALPPQQPHTQHPEQLAEEAGLPLLAEASSSPRLSLAMQVAETLSGPSLGSSSVGAMVSRQGSSRLLLMQQPPTPPPAAAVDSDVDSDDDTGLLSGPGDDAAEPRRSSDSATVLWQTNSLCIEQQQHEGEWEGGTPPLQVATAAAANAATWQLAVSPRAATPTGRPRRASGSASPTTEAGCDSLTAGDVAACSPRASSSKQNIAHLLACLRGALADNAVLCCECQHLQQLLVQERRSARASCRATSLQLAAEVVRLSAQLQAAAAELHVQQTAALAVAAADGSPNSQLADALRHEALAEAARAGVAPILDACQAEIQAFLQELQQQLAACACSADGSSVGDADAMWQQDLQQQLAEIEQAFAQDDGSWLHSATTEALPHSLAVGAAPTTAPGKPFVESPLGHVTPQQPHRSMALLRRRSRLAEALEELDAGAGAPLHHNAPTAAEPAACSFCRSSLPLLAERCRSGEDTWLMLNGSLSSSAWSMTHQQQQVAAHHAAQVGTEQVEADARSSQGLSWQQEEEPTGERVPGAPCSSSIPRGVSQEQRAEGSGSPGRHMTVGGCEGRECSSFADASAAGGRLALSEPGTAPTGGFEQHTECASTGGGEVLEAAAKLVQALQATVDAALQRC